MEAPITQPRKSRFKKIVLWTLGILFFLVIGGFIAFKVSPWPTALILRKAFTDDGTKVNNALIKYVPAGITSKLNEVYDASDSDCLLDVYYPTAIENKDTVLPVVVWTHGGGFIAGSKNEVANYCKILAGKGYVVVAIDYSLGPGAHYPAPIKQLNAAVTYIKKNAAKFHIDVTRFAFAGDSAGSQISAQFAAMISSPSYAQAVGVTPSFNRQDLRCVVLFCGPYDFENVNLEGSFGPILRTFMWSYSGKKDFVNDEYFKTAGVIKYVNLDFPPAFISVGNADPLKSNSLWLSEKLKSSGVYVDTVYFPDNYTPALQHEYQFNLDGDAGKLALSKMAEFLAAKLR